MSARQALRITKQEGIPLCMLRQKMTMEEREKLDKLMFRILFAERFSKSDRVIGFA